MSYRGGRMLTHQQVVFESVQRLRAATRRAFDGRRAPMRREWRGLVEGTVNVASVLVTASRTLAVVVIAAALPGCHSHSPRVYPQQTSDDFMATCKRDM